MELTTTIPVGYGTIKERKNSGAHYTPELLSNFVAAEILKHFEPQSSKIRVLDPATGDGELLYSLSKLLIINGVNDFNITGYDIDQGAVDAARSRLESLNPKLKVSIHKEDFLDTVVSAQESLFESKANNLYDIIIANPPYVRTQVLGSEKAKKLASMFNLEGRVDLYYAFLCSAAKVMAPGGVMGIIVSNRFMTTRSGESIRKELLKDFEILHVFDLGDTQLFEAAVLPAVLILRLKKSNAISSISSFTKIYEAKNDTGEFISVSNIIEAFHLEGLIKIGQGKHFNVHQGTLNLGGEPGDIWKIANEDVQEWDDIVKKHTHLYFKDVGKIRVGVKTTADKVFIRKDWDKFPNSSKPELLKPLITHHIAGRYKSKPSTTSKFMILYTHEIENGKRKAVDLAKYPKALGYLNEHRIILEARKYIAEAKRNWYEIWVPQDPGMWSKPKIVFRDISEQPTFWMDFEGSVVNGDCYWLTSEDNDTDLLWLALAVANSSFIEKYYDHNFNNKLYSGRRRYITQYVEKFPLPDPTLGTSKEIIDLAKKIYETQDLQKSNIQEEKLDELVWSAFGLISKKS